MQLSLFFAHLVNRAGKMQVYGVAECPCIEVHVYLSGRRALPAQSLQLMTFQAECRNALRTAANYTQRVEDCFDPIQFYVVVGQLGRHVCTDVRCQWSA